jgi:hypothetical protein
MGEPSPYEENDTRKNVAQSRPRTLDELPACDNQPGPKKVPENLIAATGNRASCFPRLTRHTFDYPTPEQHNDAREHGAIGKKETLCLYTLFSKV